METPTTDDAWTQRDGESAYAHEVRKQQTMRKLERALREISAQRANRYESTVRIVCDIADSALKPAKAEVSH